MNNFSHSSRRFRHELLMLMMAFQSKKEERDHDKNDANVVRCLAFGWNRTRRRREKIDKLVFRGSLTAAEVSIVPTGNW
jgi:hypothetical protein